MTKIAMKELYWNKNATYIKDWNKSMPYIFDFFTRTLKLFNGKTKGFFLTKRITIPQYPFEKK
jgi:hypothetical protein